MNYSVYTKASVNGSIQNILLYDSSLDSHETQFINPVLEKEVSCAGSFEFTLPATHFFYNNIKRFNTKIYIYRNDEEFPYWDGRVFTENSDMYNNRNIYCEGALSYFNDTHQPQREYKHMTCWQMLENLIANHNSKVDESRQFKVGIAPTDFNSTEYFSTQYESSLDAINKLAEEFECDIRVRWGKEYDETLERYITYRYLDFIKEFTDVCDQQIIFGENLLDFTRSYDMSNLVTVLLPLGKIENQTGDTRNRNLGNEVSDDEFLEVNQNCSWIEDDNYVIQGETYSRVDKVNIPNSDYKAKYMWVNPGETYYLTSRLQGGTDYLFYAICRDIDDQPIIHSLRKVTSSQVSEDLKEYKIEIPIGCCWLFVGGNTYDYPFVLYRDKEMPDNFEDYITAEKANNSSLYIKATPREVTEYDADGVAHTVTVDPLTEWGYVEKSVEFTIPEKVLDVEVPGDEVYQTESEKKEFRASKYLVNKANEYLTDYQFDNLQLEVSAIDLASLGVNCNSIDIFQNIRAISPKHGLNRPFPINKVKITLDNPSNNQYTLGDDSSSNLTAVNNAIDSELFAKITEVPTTSSVLAAAQKNAAHIIESSTEGYVTLVKEGDRTKEIIISNEPWENHPTHYWRWNNGGLGYTNNGGASYIDAMTNDGKIVANAITAGSMYADMIRGKTLTLGSYASLTEEGEVVPLPGDLRVLDSNGDTVFSVDQYNITFKSNYAADVFSRWTEFEQGELIGYCINNNTVTETSRIGTAMQIAFGTHQYGCYIDTEGHIILAARETLHINVSQLDVSDDGDQGARNTTLTTTVHVDGKTLTFKHGMLIGVENDEPDPE